jgi:hypothetical protein
MFPVGILWHTVLVDSGVVFVQRLRASNEWTRCLDSARTSIAVRSCVYDCLSVAIAAGDDAIA